MHTCTREKKEQFLIIHMPDERQESWSGAVEGDTDFALPGVHTYHVVLLYEAFLLIAMWSISKQSLPLSRILFIIRWGLSYVFSCITNYCLYPMPDPLGCCCWLLFSIFVRCRLLFYLIVFCVFVGALACHCFYFYRISTTKNIHVNSIICCQLMKCYTMRITISLVVIYFFLYCCVQIK